MIGTIIAVSLFVIILVYAASSRKMATDIKIGISIIMSNLIFCFGMIFLAQIQKAGVKTHYKPEIKQNITNKTVNDSIVESDTMYIVRIRY